MSRAIDGDAVKRRAWDIAEAWRDQGRGYEALLLESVVEQIVDTQPTLTPQNEPLTIEQLQEKIGGPIVINETWCYLEKIVDGIAHCWRWYMDFADEWPLKQYRKTWLAYRYPPEKSEVNNNEQV